MSISQGRHITMSDMHVLLWTTQSMWQLHRRLLHRLSSVVLVIPGDLYLELGWHNDGIPTICLIAFHSPACNNLWFSTFGPSSDTAHHTCTSLFFSFGPSHPYNVICFYKKGPLLMQCIMQPLVGRSPPEARLTHRVLPNLPCCLDIYWLLGLMGKFRWTRGRGLATKA